jgi:hypothetical protein
LGKEKRLGPGLVFPPVSWRWPQTQNDKEANFMDGQVSRPL